MMDADRNLVPDGRGGTLLYIDGWNDGCALGLVIREQKRWRGIPFSSAGIPQSHKSIVFGTKRAALDHVQISYEGRRN